MLRQTSSLLLFLFISALLICQAQTQPKGVWAPPKDMRGLKFATGELLVKFRQGKLAEAAVVHASAGGKAVRNLQAVNGLQLVRIPANASLQATINAYRSNPDVEYAEPNYFLKVFNSPNDPLVPEQWALFNPGGAHAKAGADIKAYNAWNITTGNPNVVVAVIDTGVDYLHPDLAANIFTNASDCNQNGIDDDGNGYVDDCHGIDTWNHDSDPMDDYGHGTHVAGIIGAVGNNSIGVSGVNWNVQILPCKFLDSRGYGTVSGAIECLSYVKSLKDRGVNIVATNNSWGGMEYSAALNDAIATQRDDGILFVAAAGNEFSNNDFAGTYPAAVPQSNVISVASTTSADRLSDFSNWGAHSVHLSAPGDEILSTFPSGAYAIASGTSMAAPYVSGVIALLKAQDPSRDWKQLKNLVLAGGDVVPELSQTITGRRLNAYGSLTCSSGTVYSRIKPILSPASISVGSPLTIAYMDFNCSTRVAQLQATVAETGESITLKDDGLGSDQVANDGILTGSWTPRTNGRFTINVEGGDSLPVEALTPYTYFDKTPQYRTITGTGLDLGDDDVATLEAPFPITFGNAQFDKLYVSSNGTISLSTPFKEFYNRWIPMTAQSAGSWESIWDPYQTTTLIAPWWDDLYPVKGTQQNVFWQVTGTAPERELVVEWRDVRTFECHADASNTLTFQVVFKEGSNHLQFEYAKTALPNCPTHDHGLNATVGVETSGAVGAQWSYYSPYIQDVTSVEFVLNTEPIAVNPVPSITALVPNHAAAGGNEMTLVVQGTNFVPGSQVLWGGERRATVYVSPTELHATITWFDIAITDLVKVRVFNPAPGGGTSNELPFGVGGEPPYIASLTPSSVTAGSGDFDLTIKGTGFVCPQGFIIFGTTPRDVTSVTPTEIHVKIRAYDVAKAGTYKIMAYGFAGFASNQVDFVVTAAAPTFIYNDGHGTSVPPQNRTRPMKFLGWSSRMSRDADYIKWFSRERVQPASASSTLAPAVAQGATLTAGTPLPGVQLNPSVPAGFIPTGIVAADFNHDGEMDWAVSNGGDNNVYVYIGHGNGTFEPASIIPLRGFSPVVMIGADLRKNGNTDLIVAEIDSGTVGVLLSKGDGSFEPELLHYVQGPIYSVNVGDFNSDGIPDILYSVDTWNAGLYTQSVNYFPGIGNGDFGPPVIELPTSAWVTMVYNMAVADLSNTGRSDVVVCDLQKGVGIYENSDGILKLAQTIGARYEYNLAVGDLDEDGCKDVVTVIEYGYIRVDFGHCNGTFETREKLESWGLGEIPYAIKLADVNGDGHLDVIAGGILAGGGGGYGVANGGLVSVMLGDGKGYFQYPRVYRAEQGIFDLAITDLNHDGKPDIITANQDSDSVSILMNDGQGGFGPVSGQYFGIVRDGNGGNVNEPFSNPLTFDVNGDQKPDIVFLGTNAYAGSSYPMVALLNQGSGHFSDPIRTPFLTSEYNYPFDYAVADFRRSGKLDVLVSLIDLSYSGFYALAGNQGDGTFKAFPKVKMDQSYARLAAGDFDGDGVIDAVAVGTSITFLHSNGDGTFTQKPAGTLPSSGIAGYLGNMTAMDINGDRKLDLVLHTTYNVVPYNDHAVVLFIGNGNGTFQPGQIVVPNAGRVTFADVNRDGRTDIINETDPWSQAEVSQLLEPQYLVYLGQSDSTFKLSATYAPYKLNLSPGYGDALAGGQFDSAWADYDGDQVKDFAAIQMSLTFPRRKFLQFMKGVDDGTFVPTYPVYSLGAGLGAPLWSADFDGDGKADMLEFDGYTSSFHILPGIEGKKIDAALLVSPVKGSKGTLRVFLGAASTSNSQLALAASDPNISIAQSVSIPAGSAYTDVPFTIGPAFNMNRQFRITATLGSDTATVYGTQVPQNSATGFAISTYMNSVSGIPGGDTFSQMTFLYSNAGYSGHVTLSCANLPKDARCMFANPEIELQKGSSAMTYTSVRLPADITPGNYAFQIEASDGVTKASTPLTLIVSDFSLVTNKPYVELLAGNAGTIPFGISTNGPYNSITYTCKVENNGGTCSIQDAFPNLGVKVVAGNVPLGSYPVVVTGTSGSVTHTLDLSLHVIDVSATFSATTINMKPGTQAQVTVHLTAPDGMKDLAQLTCSPSSTMYCYDSGIVEFANGAKTTDTTLYFSVPYSYPLAQSTRPVIKTSGPIYAIWLAALSALPLGLLFTTGSKRTKAFRAISTLVLVAALGMSLSCGGGSGGGSTNPPSPPPLPNTKTETFTIKITSSDFTKTLGKITVNISK